MFEDMQREDSQVPLSEVLAIKKSVGRTLYECDARVAAYSSSPLFISDDDVYELFSGTGIVVPDLERDDLGPMLDSILDERNGPIDRTKLDDAIALAGYWVCALQRAYAKISSGALGRRAAPNDCVLIGLTKSQPVVSPLPPTFTTSLNCGRGSTALTLQSRLCTDGSSGFSIPACKSRAATATSTTLNLTF